MGNSSSSLSGTESKPQVNHKNGKGHYKESSADPIARPLTPLTHRRLQESIMEQRLGGVVTTTYGRTMFIGPAAVGKTSLRHGLMNETLPKPISTQLAETRQVRYEWARATGNSSFWVPMGEEDEINELVGLLSRVHQLKSNPGKQSVVAGFLSYPIAKPAVHLFAPFAKVADLVREHKKKVKEVEEIVEAVKEIEIKEILHKAFAYAWDVNSPSKLSPLSKESSADPEVLMHVWDCGGQPVFLDVLPAFLTSRTMFVLVFDASKDLNANWKDVLHNNGCKEEREEQNYTTIDLLVRWLSSIHAHLARYDSHHCLFGYPQVLIIGTHADKLKTSSADVTKQIKAAINLHCQDKAFSELIIGVKLIDNTTAGLGDSEDSVFQEIRDETHNFVSKQLTVDTPVSWILFRKLLHHYRKKLHKPVITLAEAIAIGSACRINEEDVPSVLNFYHELGVVIYYAHIPSLSGTIICDPQWLITQFAMILSLDGREVFKTMHHWWLLRTDGILTNTLYDAVWRGGHMEPQALVDLMEHFLLAAPITCTKRDHFKGGQVKEYFVPSMLSVFTPNTSLPFNNEYYQKATPVYLVFNTGYVPPGFFIRLAAVLAKKGEFKILFRRGVYRNRITLEYGEAKVDEVVIMEHRDTVEVTVARCVPLKQKRNFRNVCRKVLMAIISSSSEALQWLPSIQVDPAFICRCTNVDETSLPSDPTVTPDSTRSASSLMTESSLLGPHFAPFTLEQYDDDYLRCDHFHFLLPNHEEQYWLETSDGGYAQPRSPPIANIELYRIAISLKDKLPQLAASMDMVNELTVIEENPAMNNKALWFLKKWNELSGDRESLADKLAKIGLKDIAEEVKPNGLPEHQPVRPIRSSLPTSKEPLKGSELLDIANNLGGDKIEALAAVFDMLDRYHDIVRDLSIHNNRLFFLQEWRLRMESRSELSQALFDIGLPRLSEMVRCGTFLQEEDDDNIDSSKHIHQPQPSSHPLAQNYVHPTNEPSLGTPVDLYSYPSPPSPPFTSPRVDMTARPSLPEIIECSRFVDESGDIHHLANSLDIGDQEMERIQLKYKRLGGQAQHLLKIWQKNINGTKQDLYELLISVGCGNAAERLSMPLGSALHTTDSETSTSETTFNS